MAVFKLGCLVVLVACLDMPGERAEPTATLEQDVADLACLEPGAAGEVVAANTGEIAPFGGAWTWLDDLAATE